MTGARVLHIVQFADAVDPAPVQAMLVDLHAARAGDDGRVWFDGAILSSEWKDAMGGTSSSRGRHHHARHPSDTGIASFARDVEPRVGGSILTDNGQRGDR